MRITKDRPNTFILEGSILILLGFVIWWYAQSAVLGLDQLVHASASLEELARYYGSLQWWKIQQTSLFNPLAAMLIVAGLVLICNAIFWLVRGRIKTD